MFFSIVYVPQYNPTVIYGTPYVVPSYSTADVVAAGVMTFGLGLAMGAMMSSSWGYSYWQCDWYGGAAYYHGAAYYGNDAWHGGYYGTSGSAYGAYGSAHYSEDYNPSTGTYARGASTSTAYGTQNVGQAYNPYTGPRPPLIKVPMLTRAGEARRPRRTARPSTRSTTRTLTELLGQLRAQMGTSMPPQRHTVIEGAAGIRDSKLIATARRHSAAGPVTLTAPVVDGVIVHRVRAAGAVAAAAADGVVVVVVAALVAAGGGSERVRNW